MVAEMKGFLRVHFSQLGSLWIQWAVTRHLQPHHRAFCVLYQPSFCVLVGIHLQASVCEHLSPGQGFGQGQEDKAEYQSMGINATHKQTRSSRAGRGGGYLGNRDIISRLGSVGHIFQSGLLDNGQQ